MDIAVLSGFIGALGAPGLHRLLPRWSGWLLALLPAGLFIYFAAMIGPVASGETFTAVFEWAPALGVRLSFYLDGLALLFALLILGIGALVTVYAGGYLEGNDQLGRFYAYLMLFMASMLGVVLADNLLGLFVFWELTSISSFLLIGFEHDRAAARSAALQALLVTGGGGLALLAGFVLLGQAGGTFEASLLSQQGAALRAHPLYLPALLLVLAGAFTKSAQAPFHFWLPGAMEAPSPVSAYLHSATMVKAGVYLLARLSPALAGTQPWLVLVGGVGLLTTLTGAFLALNHTNLKRILAYSTISALGSMVLLLGVGSPAALKAMVVFLLAHALYKGALFMLAGAVYHETGTQDVSELGGLRHKMPVLALITGLAAISLAGFGPLLSFIGKELLLEALLEAEQFRVILMIGAVLSAAVSFALALILGLRPFFGERKETPYPPHDPPLALWLGPALLAGLGLLFGLFPGLVASPVAAPSVSAIAGESQTVKLYLWHGLNTALALSVTSFALGGILYWIWPAWLRSATWLEKRFPWGPARGYEALLTGMNRFASFLTGLLQTGHLHDYMMIITATTAGLVGLTLVIQGERYQAPSGVALRFYEAILGALILIAALVVTQTKSRLAAVAALGVVGYGVSLIFVLFGAPDLAMTQILVESVTVILLVLILYHLPGFAQLSSRAARFRDAMIALAAGGVMTVLVLIANGVEHFLPISDYYMENSYPLAHGRNIVNVILVDFRGLDTLGEITVLSLAAIGVYALLKLRQRV